MNTNMKPGERPQVLGPTELVQAIRERHGSGWRLSYRAAVRVVQEQYDFRRVTSSPIKVHLIDWSWRETSITRDKLSGGTALSSPHPEAREEDVEKALAAIEKAYDKLTALCHGERWTLSIPADRNNDPDLVIGAALLLSRAALSRLAAPKPEGQANHPETPDSSLLDCSTCRWEQRSMLCTSCRDYARWEPATPEPRPAEEPPTSKESLQVEPAPSEEVFPASVEAADLIDDEIEASRRDGDWSRSYTRILSIVDETLRSQLARKDEGIRARDALLDEIEQALADNSLSGTLEEIRTRRSALREPDGRKGE